MPQFLHDLPVRNQPAPHRIADLMRIRVLYRILPDPEIQMLIRALIPLAYHP